MLANRWLCISIPKASTFSTRRPDAAQKYGLEKDIAVGRDGMVHVPHEPGVGAAIDLA